MGSLYFGTYSGVDAKKSKVILIVVIIIKWGAFQDEIQFFLIEDPFKIKKLKLVKLVGGGSVINGAYPV